jgi:carboxypeptidase D
MREFVLGNNPTGSLVTSRTGAVSVVGGENQSLSGIIPGPDPVYYGNGGGGATQSTYLFPAATRSAWKTFIAHAEPTYFKRDAN